MNKLIPLFATRPMWGIVPVRIGLGLILFMVGVAYYTGGGNFLPAIVALLSGIFMFFGFLCRIVGAAVVVMFILTISWDLFVGEPMFLFIEVAILMFVFSGAGRFSVDRAIARRLLKKYPSKKWGAYVIAETPYCEHWYE